MIVDARKDGQLADELGAVDVHMSGEDIDRLEAGPFPAPSSQATGRGCRSASRFRTKLRTADIYAVGMRPCRTGRIVFKSASLRIKQVIREGGPHQPVGGTAKPPISSRSNTCLSSTTPCSNTKASVSIT
ncbi:hypothetical protein [Streptomyces sp. NPDC047841]|uniref:hypothetical protein n=1 Tax=Streptomyces sp. NPDC047841 TaxID=3154708 RepID=UPI0034546E48